MAFFRKYVKMPACGGATVNPYGTDDSNASSGSGKTEEVVIEDSDWDTAPENVVSVDTSMSSSEGDENAARRRTVAVSNNRTANRRNGKTTRDDDPFLALKRKKIEILENAQRRENHPDYHFVVSLLPFFEDLDTVQKLYLRQNIQSLVIEAHAKKTFSHHNPTIGTHFNYPSPPLPQPPPPPMPPMPNASFEWPGREFTAASTRAPIFVRKDFANAFNAETRRENATGAGETQFFNGMLDHQR